jgi:hypothetical protein
MLKEKKMTEEKDPIEYMLKKIEWTINYHEEELKEAKLQKEAFLKLREAKDETR